MSGAAPLLSHTLSDTSLPLYHPETAGSTLATRFIAQIFLHCVQCASNMTTTDGGRNMCVCVFVCVCVCVCAGGRCDTAADLVSLSDWGIPPTAARTSAGPYSNCGSAPPVCTVQRTGCYFQ